MSQVEEVRTAADIVKIVGDYVKLRKAGANYMGLCPFHQEKTPSFAVHPVKQIFHCFGCGVGGDVFKFVMLIEGLSFPEALRRVAEKVGITLRETASDGVADASTRERAALFEIHKVAAQFFASQLGGTVEGRAARAYLADRGLSDEIVARFRLGYAPSEGTALTRHLSTGGLSLEQLERSGLVLRDPEGKRRPCDRFRRRIVFPIANERGKVVAFGGRTLGDDQPKYLNSPETPIYIKGRVLYHLDGAASAIRKLDYTILVEGYMDCIAVVSSGIENVVASCGTSLTESQARLLGRYSRKIVVNYDPDSAGVAATERSLTLLLEQGFEVKVLALPGGLDPDGFIRREGPAAYRDRLSRTPTYIDYLIERAATRHDITRPEGKVAAANAILPYLAKVPDAMLRSQLGNGLALRLGLDERTLQDELKRTAVRRETQVRGDSAITKANHAVKQLLRACLEDEALADDFARDLVESGDCEGLVGEELFRGMVELRRQGKKVAIAALEESLSSEERALLYETLFWPGEPPDREAARGYRRALRFRKAEREREKLQAEIQAAEQGQDRSRLTQLLEAKIKLARELGELRRG